MSKVIDGLRAIWVELDDLNLAIRTEGRESTAHQDVLRGQTIHSERKRRRWAESRRLMELFKSTTPKWLLRKECDDCREGGHCKIGLFKGDKLVGEVCPATYYFQTLKIAVYEGDDIERFVKENPIKKFYKDVQSQC